MRYNHCLVRSLVIVLGFWVCSPVFADMLISPTRVLLDDENPGATMVLRNTSTGSRTYRLSWEDKRANENGGYSMIKDGEEWPSAKAMVRLSPRQITVGPGENQTVRFSWRPPADLASGEYRSHLLLEVIPDISEPTASFGVDTEQEGVGVKVFMQMSFSIPVVVRHNTDAPQVSIEKVQAVPVEDGKRLGLELTFNRVGDASSYGTVVVEMQRTPDSPIERIGQYGELSVYREVGKRHITIPLRDASIPAGSVVRVAYQGINEYEGTLWAEEVFRTK